jgi:hypothetical protein
MNSARWAPPTAWLAACAAVALGTGVAIAAALASPVAAPIAAYVGGFGVVTLAAALASGLTVFVGPSVACLMAACALSLIGAGGDIRVDAIASGCACFAVAELAYRSLERRTTVRCPGAVVRREVVRYAAVLLGAATGGVLLLGLTPSRAGTGVLAVLAGAAAAVAFVVLTVREARRAG